MQTATGKTCFSEMIILFWYLRRLLCRRQILFSISSMLDGCEITETKEIGACEVLRAQELTHTHRYMIYDKYIYIHTHRRDICIPAGREGIFFRWKESISTLRGQRLQDPNGKGGTWLRPSFLCILWVVCLLTS